MCFYDQFSKWSIQEDPLRWRNNIRLSIYTLCFIYKIKLYSYFICDWSLAPSFGMLEEVVRQHYMGGILRWMGSYNWKSTPIGSCLYSIVDRLQHIHMCAQFHGLIDSITQFKLNFSKQTAKKLQIADDNNASKQIEKE